MKILIEISAVSEDMSEQIGLRDMGLDLPLNSINHAEKVADLFCRMIIDTLEKEIGKGRQLERDSFYSNKSPWAM